MPSAMLQAPFTRHEYRYNIAIRSKAGSPPMARYWGCRGTEVGNTRLVAGAIHERWDTRDCKEP